MSEHAKLYQRASFDAARSEQQRVPADETLERTDGRPLLYGVHSGGGALDLLA